MTFRRRIALLAGLSFVAAVVLSAVFGFVLLRRELVARIDADLTSRLQEDLGTAGPPPGQGGRRVPPGSPGTLPPSGFRPRPTDVLAQTVAPDGTITTSDEDAVVIPVTAEDLAVADLPRGTVVLRDATVDSQHLRVATTPVLGDRVLMVARPLTEADETVARFGLAMVVVCVVGAGVAAAVGMVVARRSARPVVALTAAAAHVADTLEFDVPVDAAAHPDDELGRLSSSIAEMLGALKQSREQQRRLVLDASHELRTPLTSLQTNLSMLERSDLDDATRAEIVRDLRTEVDELTALSTELVDLATDAATTEATSDVDLLEVAQRVAARAQRRTEHTVEVTGEPWTVHGRAVQLERLVQNLVDNAAKWSPAGAPIEVAVAPGALSVRDHGPGIPAAERDLVFERFYRTDAARGTPGSGLGLAIVRQIAESHAGTVTITDPDDGPGTQVTLRLPA